MSGTIKRCRSKAPASGVRCRLDAGHIGNHEGSEEIAEGDFRPTEWQRKRAPSSYAAIERCSDCGEVGERKGHQTCQYPR